MNLRNRVLICKGCGETKTAAIVVPLRIPKYCEFCGEELVDLHDILGTVIELSNKDKETSSLRKDMNALLVRMKKLEKRIQVWEYLDARVSFLEEPKRVAKLDAAQKEKDEAAKRRLDKQAALLNTEIAEFGLSARTMNGLSNAGATHISDVVMLTESQLLKTKNFGRKSLIEVKELLAYMGLTLGMNAATVWKVASRQPMTPEYLLEAAAALNDAAPTRDRIISSAAFDDLSIRQLALDTRVENMLINAGIEFIHDLVVKSESDLLEIKLFGRGSLRQVKSALRAMNLTLGTVLEKPEEEVGA